MRRTLGLRIGLRIFGVFSALTLFSALTFGGGCSDDGGDPIDGGVKDTTPDAPAPDGATDGLRTDAVDGLAPDGLGDGSPSDGPPSDGAGDGRLIDGAKDVSLGDLAPDQAPGDSGPKRDIDPNGGMYGKVTVKASPAYDGKGTLFVGLYTPLIPPPFFPPQEFRSISNVDFSQVGNTVTYQFFNNPAAGNYLLYAFLDDNANAAYPFLAPDTGDIVMAAPAPVTITTGQPGPKVDIDLTTVVGGVAGDGGVGDAAPTIGSLEGKISATATPALDAKGNVHVQIFNTWPPSGGPVTSTFIANADLSSPFANVKYFIGSIVPGLYYVKAFLDDNANAAGFPFTPTSDKDDLINGGPIQVRVEAGVAAVQDVVLDTVQQ